jgi:pre-mRNA-processing factor 17
MSALVEGYESSDDEVQPQVAAQVVPEVEDDDSDDEKLEAQARIDAFGLKDGNASVQARKKDGKLVVASAPDVLREVRGHVKCWLGG